MAKVSKTLDGERGKYYNIDLEYIENYFDIEKNTSNITLIAKVRSNNSNYLYYGFTNTAVLKIDGKEVARGTSTSPVNIDGLILATYQGDISHNDDGSLNISISFEFDTTYSRISNGKVETVWTLSTIPRASVPTINTKTSNSPDFNIGDEIVIYTNTKNDLNFTHKLYFNYGEEKLLVEENIVYSARFKTSQVKNQLYQLIPDKVFYENTFLLETYDGDKLIGSNTCQYIAHVTDSNPNFDITYEDTNNLTLDITNNNQQIIQNKSNLQFNLTNAESFNYATLSSVSININGVIKKLPISSSSLIFDFGVINVSKNITAVVTLTDSRGLTKVKNVDLIILSYKSPDALITLQRKSNFYSETDIKVDANYSSLDLNNTITIQCRHKKVKDVTYSEYETLHDDVFKTLILDNKFEHDVQVIISDKLETSIYNYFVGLGQPIVFIDRILKNVGINCFADPSNALEVQGNAQINGNLSVCESEGNNPINILNLIKSLGVIVEQATNSLGTYIKFSTGLMVTFQEQEVNADVTSAWGGVFASSILTPSNFPQSFIDVPETIITKKRATGTGANFWVMQIGTGTKDNPGTYQLLRGTSVENVTAILSIISIGMWK